jgi:hypothetical protein
MCRNVGKSETGEQDEISAQEAQNLYSAIPGKLRRFYAKFEDLHYF